MRRTLGLFGLFIAATMLSPLDAAPRSAAAVAAPIVTAASDCQATYNAWFGEWVQRDYWGAVAGDYQYEADWALTIMTTVPMEQWELDFYEGLYYDALAAVGYANGQSDWHDQQMQAHAAYLALYCS